MSPHTRLTLIPADTAASYHPLQQLDLSATRRRGRPSPEGPTQSNPFQSTSFCRGNDNSASGRGGGGGGGGEWAMSGAKPAARGLAKCRRGAVSGLCGAADPLQGKESGRGVNQGFCRLPAPGTATGAPTRRTGSRAPSSTGSAHSPKGLLSASAAGPGKGGLPRPTPDRPPGPEPEGAAEPHHKNSSASFCPGSAPRLGANTRTEKLPKRSRWQPVRIRINSF